ILTLEALRQLPIDLRPRQVIGVEVWRSLDWLPDHRKVLLDTSTNPELAHHLLTVFDSQITGGKRYDLATLGRQRANATFQSSHCIDRTLDVAIGIDQTELLDHPHLAFQKWVEQVLLEFHHEVRDMLRSQQPKFN
ncbi:MAG: PIG-L family deacetylase, partial [Eubacteriales bacterium]|nr:PIG-L family deacetylase [Eubacteriales bacterium]